MLKKPTITIAIPAYNEEANIAQELRMLLAQKYGTGKLEKIIVYSDGSRDATVALAKSVKSPYIKVIEGKRRHGKPSAINEMFRLSESDILILLDADLKIVDELVIEKLIKPFAKHPKVQLTSGLALHPVPSNFVERLAYASNVIWEQAITYPTINEMYFCSGSIRAFGHAFYKRLKFAAVSADDAYAYIACKKYGFDFAIVKSLSVVQKLPTVMKDFMSQSTRFIQSENIQNKLFSEQEVAMYYTVTTADKLRAMLWYLSRDPLACLTYLVLRFGIAIWQKIAPASDTALWEIATSTKKRI